MTVHNYHPSIFYTPLDVWNPLPQLHIALTDMVPMDGRHIRPLERELRSPQAPEQVSAVSVAGVHLYSPIYRRPSRSRGRSTIHTIMSRETWNSSALTFLSLPRESMTSLRSVPSLPTIIEATPQALQLTWIQALSGRQAQLYCRQMETPQLAHSLGRTAPVTITETKWLPAFCSTRILDHIFMDPPAYNLFDLHVLAPITLVQLLMSSEQSFTLQCHSISLVLVSKGLQHQRSAMPLGQSLQSSHEASSAPSS